MMARGVRAIHRILEKKIATSYIDILRAEYAEKIDVSVSDIIFQQNILDILLNQ